MALPLPDAHARDPDRSATCGRSLARFQSVLFSHSGDRRYTPMRRARFSGCALGPRAAPTFEAKSLYRGKILHTRSHKHEHPSEDATEHPLVDVHIDKAHRFMFAHQVIWYMHMYNIIHNIIHVYMYICI